MKNIMFIVLGILVLSKICLGVELEILQNEKNIAEFIVDAEPATTVHGKGGKVEGTALLKDNLALGTFKVALENIKTDDEKRDKHLKENIIPIGKYPYFILTLNPVKAEGKVKWDGIFQVKEEKKAVKGKADISVHNGKIFVKASFEIFLSEFKTICLHDAPKFLQRFTGKKCGIAFLGVVLNDKLTVNVQFEAKEKV